MLGYIRCLIYKIATPFTDQPSIPMLARYDSNRNSFSTGDPANSGFKMIQLFYVSIRKYREVLGRHTSRNRIIQPSYAPEILVGTLILLLLEAKEALHPLKEGKSSRDALEDCRTLNSVCGSEFCHPA